MNEPKVYIWATLLSKNAVDRLAVGLVRRGFSVGPAGKGKDICISGEYSQLVSMEVSYSEPPLKPNEVVSSWYLDRVREVLIEATCSWYSIIVSHAGPNGADTAWMASNIQALKKDEPKAPKVPTHLD